MGGGTTQTELCPPTSIINQKNAPTGCSGEGIFSMNVPSSQETPICVKLTKSNQPTGVQRVPSH